MNYKEKQMNLSMENNAIAVVTGANGFVGSHLVDLLISKNFRVRCIVRKSSSLRWLEGKDIEIIKCGLNDRDGIRETFKDAEYIFHVAGVVKSKKPEGYYSGNVETTKLLLDTALEFRETIKKFVVVSSLTVCGPSLNGNPVNEETRCVPSTTYGRSKYAEEELAKTYMDKLPVTICRAPAVYGERDTEILIFFNTFNKGLMTTIGFDEKVLSLIHVSDLVEGLYLAAVNKNSAGRTYFISSEKFYTWEEVGNITGKILNKKPLKVKVPHFAVYSIAAIAQFLALFSSKPATLNLEKAWDITRHAWTCDTGKAIRELGYKQNVSIEEGIKRTIDWYKKMNWL